MSSSAPDAHTAAHPLAKNLWRQLDGQSEADRRFVLNALRRRLTPTTQMASQEIAIVALQKFDSARRVAAASTTADELPRWTGGSLSKRNYNAFRDAQPDPSCWPSTTLIANAFSRRWGDALAAAGLDVAPDVLAGRGIAQGAKFRADGIRNALRAWISDVDADDPNGPLIQAEFIAWTKRNGRSCDLRYPTIPTLMRHLGKWGCVLIDLGLIDRHPQVLAARQRLEDSPHARWASRVVESLDLEMLPQPRGTRGFECAKVWLNWTTTPLPKEERAGLEMDRWDMLRAALLVGLASQGQYAFIPSAEGIKSRSDDRSWPTAKAHAGLIDPSFRTHSSPSTKAFDDAELIGALVSVSQQLGHPPSRSEYEAQRRKLIGSSRLPSDATIRTRLGDRRTWASVLELLAREHPALAGSEAG